MRNKRVLVIPPIVLYIIWLILIPILFHGQIWNDSPAVGWLYLVSTIGVMLGGAAITIVYGIIMVTIQGLANWIAEGIPKNEPDELLDEAEKEVDELLEEDK